MQVTRVIYRLVSQTTSLRHTSHSSYNNAYCTLSSSVARPRCLQHLVKQAVYYSQSTEQQRTVRVFFISVIMIVLFINSNDITPGSPG